MYLLFIYLFCIYFSGPGSSIGIATDCRLDSPGSNPGGAETDPAPPPPPASCKMDTESFPEVEVAGAWG